MHNIYIYNVATYGKLDTDQTIEHPGYSSMDGVHVTRLHGLANHILA